MPLIPLEGGSRGIRTPFLRRESIGNDNPDSRVRLGTPRVSPTIPVEDNSLSKFVQAMGATASDLSQTIGAYSLRQQRLQERDEELAATAAHRQAMESIAMGRAEDEKIARERARREREKELEKASARRVTNEIAFKNKKDIDSILPVWDVTGYDTFVTPEQAKDVYNQINRMLGNRFTPDEGAEQENISYIRTELNKQIAERDKAIVENRASFLFDDYVAEYETRVDNASTLLQLGLVFENHDTYVAAMENAEDREFTDFEKERIRERLKRDGVNTFAKNTLNNLNVLRKQDYPTPGLESRIDHHIDTLNLLLNSPEFGSYVNRNILTQEGLDDLAYNTTVDINRLHFESDSNLKYSSENVDVLASDYEEDMNYLRKKHKEGAITDQDLNEYAVKYAENFSARYAFIVKRQTLAALIEGDTTADVLVNQINELQSQFREYDEDPNYGPTIQEVLPQKLEEVKSDIIKTANRVAANKPSPKELQDQRTDPEILGNWTGIHGRSNDEVDQLLENAGQLMLENPEGSLELRDNIIKFVAANKNNKYAFAKTLKKMGVALSTDPTPAQFLAVAGMYGFESEGGSGWYDVNKLAKDPYALQQATNAYKDIRASSDLDTVMNSVYQETYGGSTFDVLEGHGGITWDAPNLKNFVAMNMAAMMATNPAYVPDSSKTSHLKAFKKTAEIAVKEALNKNKGTFVIGWSNPDGNNLDRWWVESAFPLFGNYNDRVVVEEITPDNRLGHMIQSAELTTEEGNEDFNNRLPNMAIAFLAQAIYNGEIDVEEGIQNIKHFESKMAQLNGTTFREFKTDSGSVLHYEMVDGIMPVPLPPGAVEKYAHDFDDAALSRLYTYGKELERLANDFNPSIRMTEQEFMDLFNIPEHEVHAYKGSFYSGIHIGLDTYTREELIRIGIMYYGRNL